jgi:hypothetical protein
MFPLRTIHQIEITSRCNLRCRYCPSPNLQRPKIDMNFFTFERAMWMVRKLMAQGTQQPDLNLAGIGESTIHPQFLEFVTHARVFLGKNIKLVLATNGLTMNEQIAERLKWAKVDVYVSMHRPEKAGPAIELCRKMGILKGASADPSLAAINWAGQVEWHNSAPPMDCAWVKNGWAMVMSDGRLTSCSMDASGIGVFGTVDDRIADLFTKPYGLCKTCHQELKIPGYDQRNPK